MMFSKLIDKLTQKGWIKYRATVYFDSGRCLSLYMQRSALETLIASLKDKVLKGDNYHVTNGFLDVIRGWQIDISKVTHITYRLSFLGL